MKLVEQKAELLEQPKNLSDVYKLVELAGRTCYKSEDRITEDSAKAFVDRMIASNHTAMLEHGTVYLTIPKEKFYEIVDDHDFAFYNCPYIRWGKPHGFDENHYITTSLRVIYDYHYPELLDYVTECTDKHEKRYSFRCTTNIHVYKDLTRHRKMSFAIESTRFNNYSKDKFNNELTFIKPSWDLERSYIGALAEIEVCYFDLLESGWKPQQAAAILPQSTKADMIMTGNESDWEHVFDLRYRETTGKVLPTVKELTTMMYDLYEKDKEKTSNKNISE